jgi:hypothetical protein
MNEEIQKLIELLKNQKEVNHILKAGIEMNAQKIIAQEREINQLKDKVRRLEDQRRDRN